MNTKDVGGPAFPRPQHGHADHDGMTLRDYFAAKAMVGFMTMVSGSVHHIEDDDDLAVQAYRLADTMLKERNK